MLDIGNLLARGGQRPFRSGLCALIGSFRFTWCVAFAATLQQLNDMAAQREDLADCLHTQIACDLTRYTQELKAERKTVSRGSGATPGWCLLDPAL